MFPLLFVVGVRQQSHCRECDESDARGANPFPVRNSSAVVGLASLWDRRCRTLRTTTATLAMPCHRRRRSQSLLNRWLAAQSGRGSGRSNWRRWAANSFNGADKAGLTATPTNPRRQSVTAADVWPCHEHWSLWSRSVQTAPFPPPVPNPGCGRSNRNMPPYRLNDRPHRTRHTVRFFPRSTGFLLSFLARKTRTCALDAMSCSSRAIPCISNAFHTSLDCYVLVPWSAILLPSGAFPSLGPALAAAGGRARRMSCFWPCCCFCCGW